MPYPEGVSASHPHFNPRQYGECAVCGQDHSPRRTCEDCEKLACIACCSTCDECQAWTCSECIKGGFCAECAPKEPA